MESEREYLTAGDLERLTGTKESTWRYWAHVGQGPPSFRLGKRRVWKRVEFELWLAEQEAATAQRETEQDHKDRR